MRDQSENLDDGLDLDRIRGCLLGLAVGDAVGTTAEFKPRGNFEPLTDMVGGGHFNLRAGEWTDDTSMALCLGFSLLEKGRFDAADQMARYLKWFEEGYMSSTGCCFDIGSTTRQALITYKATSQPFNGLTAPNSAGNGSIMRLAPVVLFFYPDYAKVLHYSAESSRTTHALQVCQDACILLADVIFRALEGENKQAILFSAEKDLFTSELILEIAQGMYINKTRDQIKGSGYVVNSLEAALWSFWNSDSFRQAILLAGNLGDDADTTAAVCGQIAGAFYGESGIPRQWLDRLAMGNIIGQLAQDLSGASHLMSNGDGL